MHEASDGGLSRGLLLHLLSFITCHSGDNKDTGSAAR